MKNQHIPEHELNKTATAEQVIENNINKTSSMPRPEGAIDTNMTHTNETK